MKQYTTIIGLTLFIAVGCGRDPDTLEAFFTDELVEAPVRTVQVIVTDGLPCQSLLEAPHNALTENATILTQRDVVYPIRPDSEVLADLPTGRTIAINLAAFDTDGAQVARACQEVSLSDSEPQNIKVELHPQPPCPDEAVTLNLSLALETSVRTQLSNDIDFEGMLFSQIGNFVESLTISGGVRFNIVTFGRADGPDEVLAFTEDRTAVVSALENLPNSLGGSASPYEGLQLSATSLRRQAACKHRPAILWVGSGDDSSALGTAERAVLRLIGTRGDTQDDIFVFAIGLTGESTGTMRALLDTDRLLFSEIFTALTSGRLAETLSSARFQLQALVEP